METPTETAPSGAMKAQTGVKEVTVEASNFKFTPATITVNKGETVRLTLNNKAGTHDWHVDEFNAATKLLQTGQSDTIEFTADKTGTFEYYCAYNSHRAMGMVGKLIVK
jgi:VCBS repeat-containing protein